MMSSQSRIHKFTPLFHISLFSLLMACSGSKQLAEKKQSADHAFQNGSYEKALVNSVQVIQELERKGENAAGDVYAIAGKAAYKLGKLDTSVEYLEKAINKRYHDESIYVFQADNYLEMDNLSKEIRILETYFSEFPSGSQAPDMRERLFQTCKESERYELADSLWNLLDDSHKEKERNLEIYLMINDELGRDENCDSLSSSILKINPENIPALEWRGEYYFWKAENSYQAEMKAYEANRTRKQYRQLLKAFEVVTADFKQSLEYYGKLYEMEAKPEYAKYLSNIYARLEDKEKAAFYLEKSDRK